MTTCEQPRVSVTPARFDAASAPAGDEPSPPKETKGRYIHFSLCPIFNLRLITLIRFDISGTIPIVKFQTLLKIVLSALVAIICGTLAIPAIKNLFRDQASFNWGNYMLAEDQHPGRYPDAPIFHVVLFVDELDSSTRSIRGRLYVAFKYDANASANAFSAPGKSFFSNDGPAAVKVQILPSREEIEYPLEAIEQRTFDQDFQFRPPASIPFEIPMDAGRAQAFPFDRHSLRLSANVTLPPRAYVTGTPREGGKQHQLSLPPTALKVAMSPQLVDWLLREEHDPEDADGLVMTPDSPQTATGSFTGYTFVRNFQYKWFTVGLLIIPPLIGLGHLTPFARSDQTSPFELAGALIAVISIREVLVPSDIAGRTLIDWILAIEVVVVCAGTLIATLRVRRHHPESSIEDSARRRRSAPQGTTESRRAVTEHGRPRLENQMSTAERSLSTRPPGCLPQERGSIPKSKSSVPVHDPNASISN
jgi:hypothetical protein